MLLAIPVRVKSSGALLRSIYALVVLEEFSLCKWGTKFPKSQKTSLL